MKLETLEKIMATDKQGLFSVLALLSTIGIYINSITISSFYVGALFSSIYFVINSIFLGQLFFEDENTNFRVALGLLLLFTVLAASNGLAMFIVALEIFPILYEIKMVVSILVLITIVISFMNHIRIRPLKNNVKWSYKISTDQ